MLNKTKTVQVPARVKDLSGQSFGSWKIIGFDGVRAKKTYWFCQCACKNVVSVSAESLTRSKSTQCATCSRSKNLSRKGKPSQGKHYKHPLYMTYRNMLERCYNPKCSSYADYGQRGIKICPRWLAGKGKKSGFECFVSDMGERPEGLSVDRRNNDKDYSPLNCRWATHKEQCNNTRGNTVLTYKNRQFTIAQAVEEFGIKQTTLSARLYRYGWSVEKALTTPARIPRKVA